MGFKENINQTLWGNPNDAVWLESESWGLYAPYKKDWFGGNTTMPHYNSYNSYKGLMYEKDIPPTIDESICPWGINAKSGIGNRYLMSGYKLGSEYIPVVVPTAVNTSKGQKPVYFAFSDPKAAYTNTLQLPYYDTTGYLESQKSNFSETYPSKVLGYSFISNINLRRIFVLPIIIAADSTKSVINLSTGFDTSKPFYAKYPYQPQFTVYEYFNGTTSDGIQYTEKYPYILGVYAGIFYKSESGNIIPNINLVVQSESSEEFLTKYPVLDVDDTRYMSWSDYVKRTGTGSSAKTPYGEPTYLAVIGHSKLEFSAWRASTGGVLEIQNFTSEEEAISNAFYGSSEYISHIMPKELDNKLKTGIAIHNLSNTRCGVAWYEELTEDDIYRQISYVGLPFYAGEDDISTVINSLSDKDFTSDDFRHTLMYPDFSENMITTGSYAPYASSESPLKDTEWFFDITSDYDPDYVQEGDESGDDYETKQNDRGALKTSYHTNASMEGFTAYVMSGTGLETVKTIINSAITPPTDMSADEWLKKDWYGQDPSDFILAVNRFPCDIQQVGGSKQIVIGRTRLTSGDTPLYAVTPRSQLQTVDFGTLQITPYYNSFLDYAPYSCYTLHIPYLSDYTLDPKIWLGHSCSVKVDYDVVSCSAMAEIWRDEMWYDTVYGTFGSPVPFLVYNTGSYQNAVVSAQANLESSKNSMTQSFLSTATSVVSTGVGIATGSAPLAIGSGLSLANSFTQPFDAYNRLQNAEYTLKHLAPTPTGTSGTGGVTTLTTRNFCTLIVSRPQPLRYNKAMYGKTTGFACCETGKLSSYHGLTVCSSTRLSTFTGTQGELMEIQQLLSSGVILP